MSYAKNGWILACAFGLLAQGCRGSSGGGEPGRRVAHVSATQRIYWASHRSVYEAAVKACRRFGVRGLDKSRKDVIGGQVPRSKAKSSEVSMNLSMTVRGRAEGEGRVLVEVNFYNAPAGGRDSEWGNEILSAMDAYLGVD